MSQNLKYLIKHLIYVVLYLQWGEFFTSITFRNEISHKITKMISYQLDIYI